MRIMGYLFRGYCLIYLSPVLSLYITFTAASFAGILTGWFLQTVLLTALQVFFICIQALGLASCSVGFRKNEPIPFKMPVQISLSILMASWGIFTIWFSLGLYQDLLWWSSQPQVRSLTIWDHLQYVAWTSKGLVWVLAAIILPVVAFFKTKTAFASQIRSRECQKAGDGS